MTNIYAIIETGGKQYRVSPGETITVERLPVTDGSTVELDKVILLADGQEITTGTPLVEGARVLATSNGDFRGDKILVLKYKNKRRYRNKNGHRQYHTTLMIDKILKPGETVEAPKKPRRTRKTASKKAEEGAVSSESVKQTPETKEENSSGS